MRQNFVAQFVQLLKYWFCEETLEFVMEKNWALSVDQCQLQALHFLVHLINLLNILLRYDNAKIQKPAVDQAGSRPPNWPWPYLCQFDFGKGFGASFPSYHWAGHPQLLYTIHFMLHFNPIKKKKKASLLLHRIREDHTSKWWFFWFAVSSWNTHLSSFFIFPICFKCQMVIEWLTLSFLATSHIVLKGQALMILSDGLCQLLWPVTVILIPRSVDSFLRRLEPPLFIGSS